MPPAFYFYYKTQEVINHIITGQINSNLVRQYIWTETLIPISEIAPTLNNQNWEKWAVLITIKANGLYDSNGADASFLRLL